MEVQIPNEEMLKLKLVIMIYLFLIYEILGNTKKSYFTNLIESVKIFLREILWEISMLMF